MQSKEDILISEGFFSEHTKSIQRQLWDLMSQDSEEEYYVRLRFLKACFSHYHKIDKQHPLHVLMDNLIAAHQEYCQNLNSRELIRRHNTFVMRYVGNNSWRQIKSRQNIEVRTVARDINRVLFNMIIFLFGIDGVRR